MRRISCIVPTYNNATYLPEALDSILAQTLPVDEIIIVDDGSTDNTAVVAARYADRVRYLRQENQGPSGARNTGLTEATGDYISFLDADDLWHPQKLQRQMAVLDAEPDKSFVLCHVQNFWIESLAHEREMLGDHPFTKPVVGWVCQAMLAPRHTFDLVGGFDRTMRVAEDADWFTRAKAQQLKHVTLPDVLVQRRIHGKNISYGIYTAEYSRASMLEAVLRHRKLQRTSAR